MTRRYVVTGTDTDVGKTVFSAAFADSMAARYWKPVQAGLDGDTDSETVRRLAGERVTILPEAYRLRTPCSPHEAARIDGVSIDFTRLEPPSGDGDLVIEGAGGVLVPITDDLVFADLIARWSLPVLLVARTTLGTINHSLLSIEALRSRGLEIAGIAFSGDENAASEKAITRLGGCAHLGRLPRIDPLNRSTLRDAFSRNIHMERLP